MILRRSRFLHLLPLGQDRVLAIHAVSHLRLTVDGEVARLIGFFDQPRRLPDEMAALAAAVGYAPDVLAGCLASLMERDFLTERTPDEEMDAAARKLGETHGRDPGELLEQHRREAREGALPAWAVTAANGLADLGRPLKHRLEVLLFGDCDLQMEADFLRREGARRGIDLRVAATFPDDVRFAAERAHDAIVVGALRSRRLIPLADPGGAGREPFQPYLAEARTLLEALRARSAAPILIDNLPEPTLQPLGLADRGVDGHRNRFRHANLELARLAETFPDVHVADVAAALAGAGAERLLDDGLTGFTHFGSPGWMLQRPASEKAAVHGLFPEPGPLSASVGGDPYAREAVAARLHVDALMVVLGVERKKCVVVDLDGVLWPGVLAETGAPFAWDPEVSGAHSYIGLYFGIHEALKALKRRGVLLACVSKNDEATVRELWTYPAHYPLERLLSPDDFVASRVNWDDKVDNIVAIAEELGLALDSFAFVDDRAFERENVRARLPQVEVFGEDLFALRRQLLTDPRLQLPHLTKEAAARTDLVKAQLGRQRLRGDTADAAAFVASLEVECGMARLEAGAAPLGRVEELFQRTTQFNATGRRFPVAELSALIAAGRGQVFAMRVKDRFGDHGLAAAAVVQDGEILGLAMSCRVIGLGVEHGFVRFILDELAADGVGEVLARIVATSRNAPVRNLYHDNGFAPDGEDGWRLRLDPPARRRA